MQKFFFFIMLIVLFVSADGYGQKASSPWKNAPRMKIQRSSHMMAVVQGNIYVVGGRIESKKGPVVTTSVQMFNPRSGTWTDKKGLPIPLMSAGAAVLGNRIVIAGGEDGNGQRSTAVLEYDVEKDEWATKAPMRIPRVNHALVSFGGKIYAIGGLELADEITSRRRSALAVYTIEEYDPAADEWTIKAQLPFKHFTHGAVVVNDRIYILSDSTDNSYRGEAAILEEYDPLKNSLLAKEKLIRPKRDIAMASMDNRFFVFGGRRDGALNTVEEYDLVLDQWTWKSTLPFPVYLHRAVTLDEKIYLSGGIPPKGKSAGGRKSDMIIYSPAADRRTEVVR